MVEGYQRMGLIEPANEALEVLRLNFPESDALNEKGEFIGYQSFGDVNPSLLYTVTFGLLGDSGVDKQLENIPAISQEPTPKPPAQDQ